jgi:hypothetical protein
MKLVINYFVCVRVVDVFTHGYVCMCLCMCVFMYAFMYVCIYVCTSAMRKKPVMYVFTSEGALFGDHHSSHSAAAAVVCSVWCVVCDVGCSELFFLSSSSL